MDRLSNFLPGSGTSIGTMVFRYSTDITSVDGIVSSERLKEHASRLLASTKMVSPIHAPGPCIIFVGHGYGGLICEQVSTGNTVQYDIGWLHAALYFALSLTNVHIGYRACERKPPRKPVQEESHQGPCPPGYSPLSRRTGAVGVLGWQAGENAGMGRHCPSGPPDWVFCQWNQRYCIHSEGVLRQSGPKTQSRLFLHFAELQKKTRLSPRAPSSYT